MSGALVSPTSGAVLVTGSAGFIGRHLVRYLAASGYTVHGLDRIGTGWRSELYSEHVGDVLDAAWLLETVRDVAPAAIIHLAARTDLDETRDLAGYAANTEGVSNVIAAVAAVPTVTRVLCTSSQLVCQMGYSPTHDEDYQPTTLYGRSKVETEIRWRRADGGGRTWCLVRPTTIWGPGMNPHYLTAFALIRDGRYFHVSGGPTPKSYGYVGNAVHQYRCLLEAPTEAVHRRTFYVADSPPVTLEDWTEAFRSALGAPPIHTMPRPLAWGLATVGDAIQAAGVRRFPFTSFRLRNVVTPSFVDLGPTLEVCGPPLIDFHSGVAVTSAWLRRVWAGGSRWAID